MTLPAFSLRDRPELPPIHIPERQNRLLGTIQLLRIPPVRLKWKGSLASLLESRSTCHTVPTYGRSIQSLPVGHLDYGKLLLPDPSRMRLEEVHTDHPQQTVER